MRSPTYLALLLPLSLMAAGCATTNQAPVPQEADASPGVVSEGGVISAPTPPVTRAEIPVSPSNRDIVVENIDVSGGEPVFFSFREGRLVETFAEADDWDVSFEGTDIYFNGEAQLVPLGFGDVSHAPRDGFARDTPDARVVPSGSGSGWYRYDPTQHKIRPLEDRTLLFRASDGRFVKMEILSYYRDGADPASETDEPRFYSFRYILTEPGSMQF